MAPRRVEVWIPLVPLSPNARAKLSTRERMSRAKTEREAAVIAARIVRNRGMVAPFFSGTVTFEVRRKGQLLDPSVNLPASLKHVQDGIVSVLLPEGDGPTAPYTWKFTQRKAREEGTMVTIEAAS